MAEQVLRRNLRVRAQHYRDRSLVSIDEVVLELSDTAALMWKAIDGRRTEDQIVAVIGSAYDVPLDVVRDDTLQTLAEFVQLGLAEWTDAV